jgi:mono/diheme cytochrome c family protein
MAVAICAAAAISAVASAIMLSAAGQQASVNPSLRPRARAGQPAFQTNCATCHGADLSGGPYAPPLAGRGFADAWSKRSGRDLIESIRTMPPTNPRMFDDDARLNLAAYILQVNGMAPGPARLMLTAADALASLKTSRPAVSAATPGTDTPGGAQPCPDVDASRTAANTARQGRSAGASASEWPVYGGSSSNQRYSTLGDHLEQRQFARGAWATQLPGRTNQTGLTMSNGLILPTANCKVVALNARPARWCGVYTAGAARPTGRRGR